MLQIMFACARTGQFVPTGIETDLDTFMALPEVLSLSRCPACGRSHYWTKSETWISDSLRKCPAALPADAILNATNLRGCRDKLGPVNEGLFSVAVLPLMPSERAVC
jgi:hypothetical protein